MKRYVLTVIILLFIILPAQAGAATESPATVRDLIIIGLEENIGLQVDQLNIPVSAEAVVIEESVFDTELFASADYSDSSTPIELNSMSQFDSERLSGQFGLGKKYYSGLLATISLDSEWTEDNSSAESLDPRYRTTLNLSLTQPLLRNYGSKANTTSIQVSRNQRSQTTLLHYLQAQSLALQIELLAVQLAGESEIVSLRSEAIALAKELYSSNSRRLDAGVIPVSEVQEAETSLASRELEYSLATQSRELNFESLNRQLNYALSSDFDTTVFYSYTVDIDSLNLPGNDQLFAGALEKNIFLQVGRLDIRNSDILKDFYRNQLKPQLDLNLQAGINGLSGDERNSTVSSRFTGSWADSITSATAADGYQWGAGLQFSIPLGNRQAKSRLRQAALGFKQANYRQRDLEAELRSELLQQSINLKRAYEQVKIAERFEKLAKLTLQQEQRRLEEGLSDTFRMIIIQNSMINAKIDRINALIQYYASVAQLNFTRGIILEQHNITLQQLTEENDLAIL